MICLKVFKNCHIIWTDKSIITVVIGALCHLIKIPGDISNSELENINLSTTAHIAKESSHLKGMSHR